MEVGVATYSSPASAKQPGLAKQLAYPSPVLMEKTCVALVVVMVDPLGSANEARESPMVVPLASANEARESPLASAN